MLQWRIILAIAGGLLGLFGVFRLLTEIPFSSLVLVAIWLAAAIVIHDGLLSPAVVGLGWFLTRVVPPRARRYLQAALIMGGIVTVIAVPMIYLRGSQPAVKALLLQNYGANLALILGLIAVGTLVAYAIKVARDRRATRETEDAEI
ncbi:MAG TPA: hypothetical protein VIT20_09505 [Propionibacteriaceae bacterium]